MEFNGNAGLEAEVVNPVSRLPRDRDRVECDHSPDHGSGWRSELE